MEMTMGNQAANAKGFAMLDWLITITIAVLSVRAVVRLIKS